MNEKLHLVCPHCRSLNRVPAVRLTEGPKCGQCRAPLFTGHPIGLTAADFDLHVSRADIPLVVDFWAPWCGPCRMMAPAYEQAAKELEPRVRLAKVNTEEEQSLAARFGIASIPILIVFNGGREVARQPGALVRIIHECCREAFETEARRGFSHVRPTQAYMQSVEEAEREKPRRARGSDDGAGIHE